MLWPSSPKVHDDLQLQNLNTQFTMKKEVEQKLPFLDILIDNHSSPTIKTVYRKKTFTGLLIFPTLVDEVVFLLQLLRSRVVHNFVYLAFNRYLSSSVREHLSSDKRPYACRQALSGV